MSIASGSQDDDAECWCLGPSHNNGSNNFDFSETAAAHAGVTVTAGTRIVNGQNTNDPSLDPADPSVWHLAHPVDNSNNQLPDIALYVQAETNAGDAVDHTSQPRQVDWNADVVIYEGPSPYLVIAPDGTVLHAVNITVDGIHNPAPGTDVSGGPIVVVVSGANIDMAAHRRLVSEN